LLSLEPHEELQVPEAEAETETFLELGEKRSIRRSGTQTLPATKMILNPGLALFLTKLAAI
jgi:hypothetical protein